MRDPSAPVSPSRPDSYRLDALETTLQVTDVVCTVGPEGSPDAVAQAQSCRSKDHADSEDRVETDPGVDFRHSGWTNRRRCVQRALEGIEGSQARHARFDSCGSNAWVLQSIDDPDVFKIACDKCRDRFCTPCASDRSRHIASCVGDFAEGRELRLITLTLRRSVLPLSEDLNRLYAGFTKLRRRALWRKSQSGGVFFIEIKRRREDDGWHTHLHILSEGRWIEKRDLSAVWLEITGDSFIVDVRFCESGEDAARYVAKYAGKGIHGSCYHDPDALREAILALRGRRLVGKFGTWSELSFDVDTHFVEWRPIDSLRRILLRNDSGDAGASLILAALIGEPSCQIPRPEKLARGP